MSRTAVEVPVVRTRDLAVGYRSRRQRRAVLERVSVSARRGELVCVLGPNGIGKSTLLRTLAGLQPPLWGAIELGGQPLASLSAVELARRLGMVLTERVTVESMRSRQIVALGRYPHAGWFGGLGSRDREIVAWALELAGAAHVADRDFATLSDGERQRVMVARALAQEPDLVMLDEPTAYLDVPARVELMGVLRRLAREGGLAIVLSTHDLELALRTADVVWLLVPGGELVVGAPEDVVLSGAVAAAFEGRHLRFCPEERSFHWLSGERGTASVHGKGLRAQMARAVLEREGYAVGDDGRQSLTVQVDDSAWTLSGGGADARGDTFQSLAACVRGLDEDAT